MTKKLNKPSQKAESSTAAKGERPRRWFKLEELQAICAKAGYELTNPPKRKVFVLTNAETGAWGWVLHPATENIVTTVRDLTREQWREVLDYNIQRLDEEAREK